MRCRSRGQTRSARRRRAEARKILKDIDYWRGAPGAEEHAECMLILALARAEKRGGAARPRGRPREAAREILRTLVGGDPSILRADAEDALTETLGEREAYLAMTLRRAAAENHNQHERTIPFTYCNERTCRAATEELHGAGVWKAEA